MAPEKSPAFQFYPRDFLTDEKQMVMSLEECGAYVRLLCLCWIEGSIPDDPERAARVVQAPLDRMLEMWPTLRACFSTNGEPGRLKNKRLDEERQKQAEWKQKSAEGGRKSAEHRKGGSRVVEPPSQPNGNQGATLQSSSSSSTSKEEKEERSAVALIPRSSVEDFKDAWNHNTGGPVATCRELTDKRRKAIRSRLQDRPLPEWIDIFRRIAASDFCRGKNDRGWVASIDWVLQPDTAAKVLEGKYDNRQPALMGAGKTVGNVAALEAVLNRERPYGMD